MTAGFDGAGRGAPPSASAPPAGFSGGFRECWDAGACLVYVDDPAAFSCGGVTPCSLGDVAACPVVPSPPF